MGAISLTGDFPKLAAMVNSLASIPGARRTVSLQLAEETVELIREGFERSRDPYNKPWARLKLRDGRPLEDAGGLKASWVRRSADDGGFSVASGKRYAIFHQKGTGVYGPRNARIRPTKARALKLPGGMLRASVAGSPIRRMVPNGRLPKRWVDRYRDVFAEVMAALLGVDKPIATIAPSVARKPTTRDARGRFVRGA